MAETQTRAARFAAKHAVILAAAKAVFLRQGFTRASVDEIAAAAAVSTATLYRHFGSKEGLFAAVVADGLTVIDDALPAMGGDAIADLRAVARAYAGLLLEPDLRRMMRMLIAETGDGGPMAEAFYGAVKQQLSDRFTACFEAGVAAGVFDNPDGLEPSSVAGQLQGMIEHATLMRGLVLGDDVPLGTDGPDEVADAALDTWLARYWLGPSS